jgi:DUF4097 and DUF4098 domain-containing protein YvlB
MRTKPVFVYLCTVLSSLLLTAAGSVQAAGQVTVDERRPAAADGQVDIENASGTIRVVGWDQAEVAVSGRLGHGAAGLDVAGGARRTRIEVETEGNPHGVRSDIEVRVPAGSRVQIDGFQAEITVTGVKGGVRAETVNGAISVSGPCKDVDVQSVNGAVEVSGSGGRVNAESVNGRVTVHGAAGEVDASTVNGTLSVSGATFERARLETVAGALRFDGALSRNATLDAETVSGSVELVLPAGVSADFSITTFSGGIDNELGPPAQRSSQWTPEKELSFSTGAGGAKVNVQTLSGSIRLLKKK